MASEAERPPLDVHFRSSAFPPPLEALDAFVANDVPSVTAIPEIFVFPKKMKLRASFVSDILTDTGKFSNGIVTRAKTFSKRRTFRDRAGSLVGDVEEMLKDPTAVSEELKDATLLRLKMIESAIVLGCRLEAPERLVRLVNKLAAESNESPTLTYGDVILRNTSPEGEMRTFLGPGKRASEQLFYRNHAIIEAHLGVVIGQVKKAIGYLEEGNVTEAVEACTGIDGRLKEWVRLTVELKTEMPKEDFSGPAGFRRFFNSTRPDEIKDGASGAFSAKVPTLEYLLRGPLLDDTYRQYHRDKEKLFPPQDRAALFAAKASPKHSLHYHFHRLGKPEKLMPVLVSLHGAFEKFRSAHIGVLNHQVGDLMGGRFSGTGTGYDARDFLEGRQRRGKIAPWLTAEEGAAEFARLEEQAKTPD